MCQRIRLFVAHGIYHVYNRITRSEPVFLGACEVEDWIEAVADQAELFGLEILAWCLMSNHYHLVVRTGTTPLWQPMARIQSRVARRHNHRREIVGPLWQSRYKARLIREQPDLEHLIAYVHLNPVTAGLVTDPSDYELSGHRGMIGRSSARLVKRTPALAIFDEDPSEALRRYQRLLRTVAEAKWASNELGELPWWSDPHDLELLQDPLSAEEVSTDFLRQPAEPVDTFQIELDRLLGRFERRLDLPPGRLATPERTPGAVSQRELFTLLAVDACGFSVGDVARVLSRPTRSVSRWLSRALQRRSDEPRYREHVDLLRRALIGD